jgi:hypothetical protein
MRAIEYVVLERAKQLVIQGWITEEYAVKRNGHSCDPLHPKAAKFCLGGAILRAAAEVFGEDVPSIGDLSLEALTAHTRARELVEDANHLATIEDFNDNAESKHEVIAACDKALKWRGPPERPTLAKLVARLELAWGK